MNRRRPDTWSWLRRVEKVAGGPVVRQMKWAMGAFWTIGALGIQAPWDQRGARKKGHQNNQ